MYIYKSTYVCYDVCPLTAWARPNVYSNIYKSICTRSQVPCHSAKAQNYKQKKQSKTRRFLFKIQFTKIAFGAFCLPWDFRVSGSATTCIYIDIYIYTNRPMHAIMSVCWQHQRDQMYIYKSTYVCYDVCPLTAWARPNVYIQIDLHKVSGPMPQRRGPKLYTKKILSNDDFFLKSNLKNSYSEHLVYHGISRWAGARPNVYIQIDLCML